MNKINKIIEKDIWLLTYILFLTAVLLYVSIIYNPIFFLWLIAFWIIVFYHFYNEFDKEKT